MPRLIRPRAAASLALVGTAVSCLLVASFAPVVAAPVLSLSAGRALDAFEVEKRLGVELLDAPQPDSQPVRFFGQQLDLRVLDGPARRFPLEQVQQLTGAAGTVQATQVRLDLPQAHIQALRPLPDADNLRWVIELDRPAFYEVIPTETGLRLSVQATPVAPLEGPPGLQLTVGPAQSELVFVAPPGSYPLVSTLAAPARLVLEWRRSGRFERVQNWGAGLSYREIRTVWEGLPQRLMVAEFDPTRMRLGLLRSATNLHELTALSTLAAAQGAWAAINGSFFNRNTAEALGALRATGRWWTSSVAGLPPRGAVNWQDNLPGFDRLNWSASIRLNDRLFPVAAFNSTVAGNGFALYTPDWGSTYRGRTGETLALVRAGRIESVFESASPNQEVPIPADAQLLVARSEALRAQVRTLAGATAQLDIVPSGDGSLLQAGPLLIKDGQIVLDATAERFQPDVRAPGVARTVIARRGSQGLLIVACHDGTAAGLSLEALARLLLQLGVSDALNLDGGGSSAFYLGSHLRDREAGAFERAIHNGLGLWPR
ncbi:phosphodiester glycosidase family protein [Gloeobacter kilaueensis]|uniref:Phosphodiester glycosidase domain-containing protein n=1 Tax=Gloeobacter kilaueensis (strain ATCC BAA-2537 / CCAP 1431/1 / ULC 316 / JS1) TaxID=1183438 RepID=U5QKA0_GLOK1|nr:phosphodiester glycosidase family protein [Gloeobacter kilaueensis]AGY59392.1 hypothetical protein GKIL_3146 [Gloeobacter kilaueensis JS1]